MYDEIKSVGKFSHHNEEIFIDKDGQSSRYRKSSDVAMMGRATAPGR